MLHHLADSFQWKKINCLYPDFGKEARNLRLGLASNLQLASLVVHEAKIHYVVYDDIGAKTSMK